MLYFDGFYPADRGQAYVGASKVRSAAGLFYFGRVRRSDWLPVGGPGEPMEHTRRTNESMDSHSDEENDVDEASSMSEPDDDDSEGMYLSDSGDESEDFNPFLQPMGPMDGESEDARAAAAALSAACFWPKYTCFSFLPPNPSAPRARFHLKRFSFILVFFPKLDICSSFPPSLPPSSS